MDQQTKDLMAYVYEISTLATHMQTNGNLQVAHDRELSDRVLAMAEEFAARPHEGTDMDTLLALEAFAAARLRQAFPVTNPEALEKRWPSFQLPNGAKVTASPNGDAVPGSMSENGWSSLDITITLPNGEIVNLCTVDFERAGSNRHHDVLRVLAYEYTQEDPAYDLEFPWEHYSCWIQHEEADDTYDICIWDEFGNERDQGMEEARFPTLETAQARLWEIRDQNRHIYWKTRPDTTGKG